MNSCMYKCSNSHQPIKHLFHQTPFYHTIFHKHVFATLCNFFQSASQLLTHRRSSSSLFQCCTSGHFDVTKQIKLRHQEHQHHTMQRDDILFISGGGAMMSFGKRGMETKNCCQVAINLVHQSFTPTHNASLFIHHLLHNSMTHLTHEKNCQHLHLLMLS